jgi:AcrR family transcriptional regulator
MAPQTARRSRPRDRKQQILAAAADLFAAEGFDQVSVGQIAASVDITPGALYRHYAGKEDLLAAVLADDGARMLGAADGATSLEDLLERQAREAVRMPSLGVLWARELRHLGDERREAVVDLTRQANARYVLALQDARPDLDDRDAGFLAWSIQSVLVSLGAKARGLREADLVVLLTSVSLAVARVRLPVGEPTAASSLGPGLALASKRERLLAEAGRLFGERGYLATSLADVGRAAGVTGPGIYSHFESKEALVAAALERAYHSAWIDLRAVLDEAATPGEALEALVASYAGFAHRQPYLVASLVSDVGAGGDWPRRQREYAAEWDALLLAARPELDPAAAHVRVRAALAVVGNLARMRRQAARPGFVADASAVGNAVLASWRSVKRGSPVRRFA